MSNLPIFNGHELRTATAGDGSPLFCVPDVCKILGYLHPRTAVYRHCENDGVLKRDITDVLGRRQEVSFINEGNLFRLILRSKRPEAREFEHWVMHELLPTIVKTGSYSAPGATEMVRAQPQPLVVSPGDDPVLAMLGAVTEMRRQQLALESRVENVEAVLASRPQGRSPEDLQIRRACMKLGGQIARSRGLWRGVVMSNAYALLEHKSGINLEEYASEGFATKIDFIESRGLVRLLFEVLQQIRSGS